jgi:hypothetical protein
MELKKENRTMKQKSQLNPVLQIDPEFESKIPPLTDDEYKQLEENIISEGVILMPLIVWNNTIVDGHNRYKIVQAHPHIIFDVIEKDFDNRYEALAWICKNQLGRRNLTPIQKKMLVGDRYNAEKHLDFDCGNQYTLPAKVGVDQNDPPQKRHGTRTRIAKETQTNEGYVQRAGKYCDGATAGEAVSPGFRQDVLSGKIKPTQKQMQAIARASPEERKPLVDQVLNPPDDGSKARQNKKPSKPGSNSTKGIAPPSQEKSASPIAGKSKKDTLAAIQKISDEMAMDKPGMTPQKAVQQFEWKVTRMLQSFDSTFDEWPQLINEEVYHQQVRATLQDLKNYILQIEGGTRYEWDYEARKIV